MHTEESTPHVHGCGCGCGHEHEHEHKHEHLHVHEAEHGAVSVEAHTHEDAAVVTGLLCLFGSGENIKEALKDALEDAARQIVSLGGLIGHIKALTEVKSASVFSVTEKEASRRDSPADEVKITVNAIVFFTEPDRAADIIRKALEEIKQKT